MQFPTAWAPRTSGASSDRSAPASMGEGRIAMRSNNSSDAAVDQLQRQQPWPRRQLHYGLPRVNALPQTPPEARTAIYSGSHGLPVAYSPSLAVRGGLVHALCGLGRRNRGPKGKSAYMVAACWTLGLLVCVGIAFAVFFAAASGVPPLDGGRFGRWEMSL